MNLLPAIIVGGPPHSGKSVLSYSLTQALRVRNVPHYLLRAAPDGEGDWSNEIPQHMLHDIRFKGTWTNEWVSVTCRDVAARTLPLLIDMGGKPTPEQGIIFDQCTGAILLTPDSDARSHWRSMVLAHGLPILADLHSDLRGENSLNSTTGEIVGVLAGLERGAHASGPAFDALVSRLSTLFTFHADELRRAHFALATKEVTIVDFGELALRLYPHDPAHKFQQTDAEDILQHIPLQQPIALYGRAPVWLTALLGARRNVRLQFDVRLGWVEPPLFVMTQMDQFIEQPHPQLRFEQLEQQDSTRINIRKLGDGYLDLQATQGLLVPFISKQRHVVLSGPLPLWFFVALGKAYAHCKSVIAEQPQHAN